MPTVCFTGRPLRSDESAVTIVTPALGPSFGIAPAGTCTWKRFSSSSDSSIPSSSACARTHVSAICADSFITSPSWPVSVSPDSRPGIALGSTNSTYTTAPLPRRAGGHRWQSRALGRLVEHLLAPEGISDHIDVDHHGCLGLAARDA